MAAVKGVPTGEYLGETKIYGINYLINNKENKMGADMNETFCNASDTSFNRCEISQAENGFIVLYNYKQYVFTNQKSMQNFLSYIIAPKNLTVKVAKKNKKKK